MARAGSGSCRSSGFGDGVLEDVEGDWSWVMIGGVWDWVIKREKA